MSMDFIRPVGWSESGGGSFSRKWNSQRQGVWGPLVGSRWGARGRSPLKLCSSQVSLETYCCIRLVVFTHLASLLQPGQVELNGLCGVVRPNPQNPPSLRACLLTPFIESEVRHFGTSGIRSPS